MKEKAINIMSRRLQAALEDATERSHALCRLLSWASEEAKLLGHSAEAQVMRDLSLVIGARELS